MLSANSANERVTAGRVKRECGRWGRAWSLYADVAGKEWSSEDPGREFPVGEWKSMGCVRQKYRIDGAWTLFSAMLSRYGRRSQGNTMSHKCLMKPSTVDKWRLKHVKCSWNVSPRTAAQDEEVSQAWVHGCWSSKMFGTFQNLKSRKTMSVLQTKTKNFHDH